jgi:hypothetical protein
MSAQPTKSLPELLSVQVAILSRSSWQRITALHSIVFARLIPLYGSSLYDCDRLVIFDTDAGESFLNLSKSCPHRDLGTYAIKCKNSILFLC